jgi:nitroreductase
METWDAIRARRNVRTFRPDPIPAEHLDRILEAGWRSPSSKNEQRWDFVICIDRDQLPELAKAWIHGGHIAGSAATLVLIAPDSQEPGTRESIQYDLGQVSMTMMLAAADLGIGSCHSAIGDHDLVRRLLGYPADREALVMISLGYPADRPLKPIKKPNRRPFEEVVHRGHW